MTGVTSDGGTSAGVVMLVVGEIGARLRRMSRLEFGMRNEIIVRLRRSIIQELQYASTNVDQTWGMLISVSRVDC